MGGNHFTFIFEHRILFICSVFAIMSHQWFAALSTPVPWFIIHHLSLSLLLVVLPPVHLIKALQEI